MRRQNAVVINSRRNLSQLVRNYQKGSPPISIKFQAILDRYCGQVEWGYYIAIGWLSIKTFSIYSYTVIVTFLIRILVYNKCKRNKNMKFKFLNVFCNNFI